MDGVIGGEMFAQLGKYQKKRRVGNDASGWVQVQGETPEETLAKMTDVFSKFKIEAVGKEKKYVKES